MYNSDIRPDDQQQCKRGLMQEFYTVEEVARLFRVSEQTIRLWIKAGKLQSKKVGRAHLIPAASVQALLDTTNGESSGNSLPVLLAA